MKTKYKAIILGDKRLFVTFIADHCGHTVFVGDSVITPLGFDSLNYRIINDTVGLSSLCAEFRQITSRLCSASYYMRNGSSSVAVQSLETDSKIDVY